MLKWKKYVFEGEFMNVLSFEHVSFRRDKNELLHDINWQIKEHENWGVLGLNGAGKTLLLQLISGYLWPTTGRLEVLGQVFGKSSIPDLQKRIGWVSSALQYQIRNSEISEMIVLSGKFASIGIYQDYTQKDLNKAKEILAAFGGEKLIGKKYQVLSQGERQIVLICRALMTDPELLILDEPCNGLDLFAREELLNKVNLLAQNKNAPSLLFVTHHTEELLPVFNKMLMLKKGTIFAQGSRSDLFTQERLREFYGKPIRFQRISPERFMILPDAE